MRRHTLGITLLFIAACGEDDGVPAADPADVAQDVGVDDTTTLDTAPDVPAEDTASEDATPDVDPCVPCAQDACVAPGALGRCLEGCLTEEPCSEGHLCAASAARSACLPSSAFFTVVTFNTGTTEGLDHDEGPDDGYTSIEAGWSDSYYGDGLAWQAAVEATRAFFDTLQPDLVVFQEIFYSPLCESIPEDYWDGFVCETWQPEDPTVALSVLGDEWQLACHTDKTDKCAAVHASFGRFEGCESDVCMDGLWGTAVPDCGRGARIARGEVVRTEGASITLTSVHGTSGFAPDDIACRAAQVDQVFVDLGDGAPAANGALNLILGDLNTDPGRAERYDESAAAWMRYAAPGQPFRFLTAVGEEGPGAYLGFDIDHVLADHLGGTCEVVGMDDDPVYEGTYFDHHPVVCRLAVVP